MQRGFGQGALIGIIAIVILGGGALWVMNSQSSSDGDAMQKDDTAMEKDGDAMMEKDGDAMEKKDGEAMMQKDGDAMMQKDGDAMMEGDHMMKDDAMMKKDGDSGAMEDSTSSIAYTGTVLQEGASPFIEFNQHDFETTQANGDTALLWYYANWCPTCRVEQASIEDAVAEFQTPGVVIFRVNINDSATTDEEVATAREYGVAFRHTKVAVKGNERVLKTTETWNKGHYLEQLALLAN